MITFKQFLAEQWSEKKSLGYHAVKHYSKIDGHMVNIRFDGGSGESPHYEVSFTVDGSQSQHGVPSKTGSKIFHHVAKIARQFPERYPHAKSVRFSAFDASSTPLLSSRKSNLYHKLAKRYAGNEKIETTGGKTKIQLREWIKQHER